MLKQNPSPVGRFSKERIAVLGLWFALLVGIRVVLGFVLDNVWIGTIGAVILTFAIFYASINYTSLHKHRRLINDILVNWYRKKYFYISGIVTMTVLGSILFFAEYGHSHFSDKLVTINLNGINEKDLDESLQAFAEIDYSQSRLAENLKKYSPIEIMAITIASADKSLDGYYSKLVSYLFAENIEIMAFLFFIRSRNQIFSVSKN